MRTSRKTATRKPARKSATRKTTARKTTRKTTSKSGFSKMSTGKKVGIAALLGAGIYYAFGSSTPDTPSAPRVTQKQDMPVVGGKPGYNSDGSVRSLTDAEVQSYLSKNADLEPYFNNPVNSANFAPGNTLNSWANYHWQNFGNKEGRSV